MSGENRLPRLRRECEITANYLSYFFGTSSFSRSPPGFSLNLLTKADYPSLIGSGRFLRP
jgi:hypothetical protein